MTYRPAIGHFAAARRLMEIELLTDGGTRMPRERFPISNSRGADGAVLCVQGLRLSFD